MAEQENARMKERKAGMWIDSEEAAVYLGCSVQHLYNLCKRKSLKHKRLGKLYRFKKVDLDSYEDAA